MADSDGIRKVEVKYFVTMRRILHLIAIFEAIKGIAALAAIRGMLDLMHRDVRRLAIELIGRFGLTPTVRQPCYITPTRQV
jgi:hypothetical protein